MWDKNQKQNNLFGLICFTMLLTIAIDSCLLFADRHVCMNGQLQGTKRTLLPHAVPTLQCMIFHKDGI